MPGSQCAPMMFIIDWPALAVALSLSLSLSPPPPPPPPPQKNPQNHPLLTVE